MSKSISIPDASCQLLAIVEQLHAAYKHLNKRFTLDGRLVGDIGEVLVEHEYDVKLFEDTQKHYDARSSDGRRVQIKATMQNCLTFPADNVPDNYIGIQINSNGTFAEIFNGPGKIVKKALRNRKPTKTNQHVVSVNALKKLNKDVKPTDRIPKRSNTSLRRTTSDDC